MNVTQLLAYLATAGGPWTCYIETQLGVSQLTNVKILDGAVYLRTETL